MTEEERKKHIGHLVEMHIKLTNEIRNVALEYAPHIEIWKILIEEFQSHSTERNRSIVISKYPSDGKVAVDLLKLRRKKWQLRRVKAAALKKYGIELR